MNTPKKLIVEPTTRCNFKCPACVKQSGGCRIPEGELPLAGFEALAPLLPGLHTLVLTGIGEPLMHPDLEKMLTLARDRMGENTVRGIQTNGKLMTPARALTLIRSGLNRVCVSVDASDPALFNTLRSGGSLSDVEAALDALDLGHKEIPGIKRGVEFVLMRRNMDQLPRVVEWAGHRGLDFILVTHVTAYSPETEKEQVFMDNSQEGLVLFEAYRKKAAAQGLDLGEYNRVVWKFYKTEREQQICSLVRELKSEALSRGIYVNLFHLLDEDPAYHDRVKGIFDRSAALAERFGMELTLPEIRPRVHRRCPFVEEEAMFVTWDGQAAPCYFLWHGYQTMRQGYVKTVNPVVFGNIFREPPESIWSGQAYAGFRKKVSAYDYPNCHSWCETRCDYVLDDPFTQDCFINDIPCCDCHWNLGFLNCLN